MQMAPDSLYRSFVPYKMLRIPLSFPDDYYYQETKVDAHTLRRFVATNTLKVLAFQLTALD